MTSLVVHFCSAPLVCFVDALDTKALLDQLVESLTVNGGGLYLVDLSGRMEGVLRPMVEETALQRSQTLGSASATTTTGSQPN